MNRQSTVSRSITTDELRSLVRKSPTALAAHDKSAWLELFAEDHTVEDPVGGRPVIGGGFDKKSGSRGRGPLSRFWDTFIEPNNIRFHQERDDIVTGLSVVRDVTIEVGFPGGVTARAPMHLLYEVTLDEEVPRIRRHASHWEPGPMFAQVRGVGPTVLRIRARTVARMIRLQGVGGAHAYGRSRNSVGEAGKRSVLDLVHASQSGDQAARNLLGGKDVRDIVKIIAAGDTVTVSCTADGVQAVVFFYLNRKTMTIRRCDVYS
ncbi:nuclear transport factor 2 family protein [Rhodococcus sp. BE178]|uniref:nuclear transport factor 2 family protein n=1 Tax=Rhodococcus sp. BE178 TaxID=2817737 RepID=UPI003D1C9C97